MKRILTLLSVTLFAASSFANIRVDDTNNNPLVPQQMEFDLAVSSTFVYKLLNDKADSDAGTAGQQEDQVSSIDLGNITGGIAAAGQSNLCSDLTGLTQASALGVSAQAAESETGIPVVASSASCYVYRNGSDIDLRMGIPMESILAKSGSGTISIDYGVEASTALSFQDFSLCEGAVSESLTGASMPACATAKADVTGAIHGHSEVMHVLLRARLAGTGAKAAYHDVVNVALTEVP